MNHSDTQISKEKFNAVDRVRVVLSKTVGSASTAWTSRNLGGLAEKNAVALKGGVQCMEPHLEENMFLQAQQA